MKILKIKRFAFNGLVVDSAPEDLVRLANGRGIDIKTLVRKAPAAYEVNAGLVEPVEINLAEVETVA
ncbi:hypothetical protein LCGC14_1369550 [marine sediment metagenome]|uniref:Uncharacterized protein n=1 Tax=marine sediment metagenome TaxID=412755 RepID=A0A0F9N7Q2_9ZZZZ